MCDNIYQQRCIVAVYRSKERPVYRKYVNDLKCDETVVRFRLM